MTKTAADVIAEQIHAHYDETDERVGSIVKDILAEIDAAGFVVVPKEPTQKMLVQALHDYMGYERQGPNKPAWNGRSMWRTMINEAKRGSDAAVSDRTMIPQTNTPNSTPS